MVPDSMVVWIRYSPNSASDKGQIRAIIHNDNDVKDPGTDYNQVVAVATVNPTKTNGWVRFSVPFSREGCGSQDARYCLVSITTNATPGGGAKGEDRRYWERLGNYIKSRWSEPPGSLLGNARPQVTIELSIAADGRVTSARIIARSGNAPMDESVQRMLSNLDRVPAPSNGSTSIQLILKTED